MVNNQLLSVRQLSEALGFNVRTIRIWCDKGTFPTARRIGSQWRVLSDDVALQMMLDGHTENAAMLAAQNSRIDELERQVRQCQADYQHLMQVYETSLAEQNQLEATVHQLQQQNADLHTQNIELQTELKKYQDYYRRQQQERRSGGRRKAA